MSDLRTLVAEPVRLAARYQHRLAARSHDGSASELEAELAVDDRELFLLHRMDVSSRHVTTRWQEEIEREQRATSLCGARVNDDALAADRVVDYASGRTEVGHVGTVIERA